jgi:mRNA interferase RelE/StbE
LRIKKGIEKLAFDPIPHNAVRVEGQKEKVFRIRIGDFRVLYVVHQKDKEITVFKIDKRQRVYE